VTAGARKGLSNGPVAALSETRKVVISDLVRDPAFQVRAGLDEGTVIRYSNVLASDTEALPSIRVALVEGALVVVDGWHRLAAHDRRGLTHIQAEIVEVTAREAQWLAASANLTHGLPLAKAEIRTALKALIKARKHIPKPGMLLSYRDLAVLLGGVVQHTTVRNWMVKDHPKIASQMGQAGPFMAPEDAHRDDEMPFANAVHAALATASANAKGVREPGRRGDIITAVRRLLTDLQGDGKWTIETALPWEF
jgi:hypothetical protein